MTDHARILLAAGADEEARFRGAVPELNGNLDRWAGDLADGSPVVAAELMTSSPEVVAFGPDLPLDAVLAAASQLDRLHPLVEVLIVAEPSPSLWEQAARAGVREVVSPIAAPDQLAAALRRVMATAESARCHHAASDSGAGRTGEGELIVVRSAKGGSGKTMVASNLAVLLADAHPGEVAIVDLDLQFGDVATALGLEPQYTIADATANAELNATSLKALLATHRSKLHALCAPALWSEAYDITGDDVAAVLGLLRETFRYVVVDTPAGLDEPTLAALGIASQVVLLCSLDVSSVRALRREVEVLASGSFGARRHFVLNRADSKVALEVRDVEATIGARLDLAVPSARAVPLNMNCGIPVVEAEPSAAVTRQLRLLALRVDPSPARRPAGGLLRRRRR
jgi:pilus assembly protein CpaE